MRMCDETVTVWNARVDPATGYAVYRPTVLRGVSWHCRTQARAVDGGLKPASVHLLRIPVDVDAGGRTYAEPADYAAAAAVGGLWTLQAGDVIALGEVTEAGLSPAQLRERCGRVMTVLGVGDDRRAPNAGHWRVTGE